MAGEALPSLRQADALPDGEPALAGVDADPLSELERLRRKGVVALTLTGWGVTLILVLLSLLGGFHVLLASLVSAGLNVGPSLCALERRHDGTVRLLVTVMAAVQPGLVIFALIACGFPNDSHLAFFIALAALSILCDLRAIWLAAGIIVAHHALSGWAFPDTMVDEPTGLTFVLVQSLRTLLVAGLAHAIIVSFKQVLERLETTKADSARRAEMMHEQAEELERALRRVEVERQERERFEAEQAQMRKAEIRRIAQDFEDSISVVTGSISQTAHALDQTTKELNAIARDTGESADTVSASAQAASKASRTVAQGVAELSSSIANIAVNVGQQDDLTSHATQRSISGGEAVGGLAQHSDTIGEATRAIVRIAERTNLLSLNAAIEAASAGAAGRGFTIVAQEVKALALQASEAATEIDDFLKGVRAGTHEAEHSFKAIDSAITELAHAATAIRWDVESQRKSADTIEDYARAASVDIGAMAERSKALAQTAHSTQELSTQLDQSAAAMLRNVRDLEQATSQFVANLKAN